MNDVINVTPSAMAGIVSPDGFKHVSPEAQDVLDRLKAHYQSLGKPSAAHNYYRHLKSFFAWAEKSGYPIRALPAEAVETFLAELGAAGQKESTLYVMRTQLKSALRECHNSLGVDFAHLEYQTGKPREVRRQQKEREKLKRQEKRVQQTLAQAAAIEAARASGMPVIAPPYIPPVQTIDATPLSFDAPPQESSVSTQNAPETVGSTTNGAAAPTQQQPVVVVQMPPQNQRPTTTIGAPRPAANNGGGNTTTVGKGMTINSHTFTGPFVRISRMADGTDPLTPPGTETYITTVPLTQLLPHGDVAAYLQSFVIPNLRLSSLVSQVHFIFHELNDRRQPTGRRDELVVSIPLGMGASGPTATPPPAPGLSGMSMAPPMGSDNATNYLLRKLDDEAASARKRAEELQEKLRSEKDAQTTFLLMQQFQKEQDLRRELEDRKAREIERMREPPPMPPLPPQMFLPPPPPPPPERIDSGAEMARAFAESQSRMMEAMMGGLRQPPPPPQKDVSEWLIPFIGQMNQQMMAQQQANQQFMQALLTRENPVEKILLAQMQEVKAAASAPKEDEMESFANKLQKMKMVSDMLGGGGGGSSIFGELLANAEAIGEGAAKIIAASKSKVVLPDQPPKAALNGVPPQRALPPQPAPGPQTPPPVPPMIEEALGKLSIAAKDSDDQAIVTEVVNVIRGMIDGPEPLPKVGQRLLNAFKEMDDPEEMYTFVKTIYSFFNRKPEKDVVKIVANTLVKWYEVIHEQIFGTPKQLGGIAAPQDDETAESDENAETAEAGETAETQDDDTDEDGDTAETAGA